MSSRDQYDVLVIDDSDIARASMGRSLSQSGLAVLDLPSPIGATRSIVRHNVRLVVIDINMPSMRGDKLAALFRNNDRLKELKLVLVSRTEPERLSDLAVEVGADGVVSKSAGTDALVHMVRQLIEVRRR